jgi:hypothetical protein
MFVLDSIVDSCDVLSKSFYVPVATLAFKFHWCVIFCNCYLLIFFGVIRSLGCFGVFWL